MAFKRPLGQSVRTGDAFYGTELTLSREAWRYTGPFTRFNRFKRAFPGLGIATGAFAVYLVYEALFLKKDSHHGEGHGEDHH